MTAWLLPLAVGFATGILSAWGVGGGTLLLLCMTLLLGVDQRTAQTINLLYFLPTAGMGLLSHGKSGLLEKPVLRSAVPTGFQPRCGVKTGTLPRNRLASSATGGASTVS